jgi:hypothetical protein
MLANIAGADALLVLAILVGEGIWLWGVIDASVRPSIVFRQAGSSKALWVILQVVFGFPAAVLYFALIRRRVVRVQRSPYPAAAGAGWHPDPGGRHHSRYWDGQGWTTWVSDDGVPSVDPY